MTEWLRSFAQLTMTLPRVWDTRHHLLHYRWRQLSAVLMTETWAGAGILIWWSKPRYHKSSDCHVCSCDVVTLVVIDVRCLRTDHGQLNKLNTFVDLRSYFTLLRHHSHSTEFFLGHSWTVLYLECKIINSTKEYFLFSQAQPED